MQLPATPDFRWNLQGPRVLGHVAEMDRWKGLEKALGAARNPEALLVSSIAGAHPKYLFLEPLPATTPGESQQDAGQQCWECMHMQVTLNI